MYTLMPLCICHNEIFDITHQKPKCKITFKHVTTYTEIADAFLHKIYDKGRSIGLFSMS